MGAPKGHPPYAGSEKGGKPKQHTDEFIEAEAEAFEEWMQQPDSIYFKKFALSRGYHPQRLSEFADKNQRFAEVYKRVKEWQENKLLEGGLLAKFNPGFTKFAMANICGWYEKQQVISTNTNETTVKVFMDESDGATKDLVNDTNRDS